ncbi:MAG: zinc-binding dehydrogenase [Dongiaceae bacterium]
MSRTMQAVVMTVTGGPEVLALRSVALPWPRHTRDVLVRLKAAALNPADAYFRSYGPYIKSDGPCVLGHDGAGLVEETGTGVTRVKPGDRVCFCNGGIGGDLGTYAEFAVVPQDQLVRIPDDVDWGQAAALPLVTITAWESLYERAALAQGEPVLIHGGAGGTGHVAVQLAKLRGARIAATVSSPAKAEFLHGLGAERAILYREEDFVEAALTWSGGEGVAVALDNVGGETLQRTFRAMAPYGRIVTLMGLPGDDADGTAYNRNLTLHNVMMLTPMWLGLKSRLTHQAEIVARAMALLAAGKLRLHIDSLFPLAEAAAAHRRLEAGSMTGKVVLRIGG